MTIATQKLHRAFFARLMLEHSRNPSQSPFFQSFLSTYHSAVKILALVREIQKTRAIQMENLHPLWSASLVSAVSLGQNFVHTKTQSDTDIALAQDYYRRCE